MALENFPKISLISENKSMSFFIQKHLESKGVQSFISTQSSVNTNELKKKFFDLYIIDLESNSNALNILKTIREYNPEVPLVILSSSSMVNETIKAFNLGANLWHGLPLNYELFVTQINNLLRNLKKDHIIKIGDLYIDVTGRVVKKNNVEIHLTHNEFNLLLMLVKEPCRIFSRDMIVVRILADTKDNGDTGAVDTLISRLRKKMGSYNGEKVIETIYKSGFRLSLEYFKAMDSKEEMIFIEK